MRCVGWSFTVTGLAVATLVGTNASGDDTSLRLVGAGLGAALGVAGTFLSRHRLRVPRRPRRVTTSTPLLPLYFRDRRQAPRHEAEAPVRVTVNGHAFMATLLNVGSGGALLRVATEHVRSLRDQVGQPVSIHDYPAGSLTRVGARGMYVDFAVAFDHAATSPALETVRSAS